MLVTVSCRCASPSFDFSELHVSETLQIRIMIHPFFSFLVMRSAIEFSLDLRLSYARDIFPLNSLSYHQQYYIIKL